MNANALTDFLRALFATVLRDEVQAAVEAALENTLPEVIRRSRTPEWQDRPSAAAYVGVSLRTLDGLRQAKKLAWSKRRGRVMLRTSDLDHYLFEGRVETYRQRKAAGE